MAETESTVQILLRVAADKAQLTALQADFAALKETGTAAMAGVGSSADDLLAHLQQIEQAAGLPNFQQGFSNATQAATAATQATEATSLSAANWSDRMLAANLAGEAWNAQSTTAVATQLGLGEATAKTAANFAIATPAMRAWSVATNEQRAAMQALIATDNAAGFERLVAGILAGTAATKGFNVETGLLSAAAKELTPSLAQTARGIDQTLVGALRLAPGMSAASGAVRGLGMGAITTAGQLGVLNAVMIGAGVAGILALTASIAALIAKGIELNKQLQDVKSGVAGTLSTDSNFRSSQINLAGAQTVEKLTEASRSAQVPLSELVKAFNEINPAATRANASIDKQVQLVAQLTAQSGALHIPQARLISDLGQLFNGNVQNSNQLAARLGLEKETVQAARENGTVTDLLIQKEQEYAAAHQEGGDTIERAQQKVQSAFELLAAAAAKPLVEPATRALNALSASMSDPAMGVGAAAIVSDFEKIIEVVLRVVTACNYAANAIANALRAAENFRVDTAKMVFKGGAVTEGDTSLGFDIKEPPSPSGRTESEQAVVRNLAQEQADQFKRAGGMTGVEEWLPQRDVTGAAPGLKPPPAGAGGGRGGGGGGKGPSQDTLDQQEISDIMSQINEKQAAYNTLVEKNKVDHELGRISLTQEQAAIVSAGDKYGKSLDANIAKLTQEKQKILDLGVAQDGLNPKEDQQVNKLQAAIDKLTGMKSKLDLVNAQNTFGGQLLIGLNKFNDSLQLTGTKVAQTFGSIVTTGINAASSGLTQLIFKTGNWRDTFVKAGESIIESILQIVLQYTVGRAVMAAINLAFGHSEAAGISGAASAAATAWSAAGIAASIASYGAAAGAGLTAFTAAMTAGTALGGALAGVSSAAGLAEGGIVPGSPSSKDNMIMRMASGEGVITAAAVQYYGPSVIHAMNAMTAPSFAGGGIVGGGSFGGQGGGGTASKGVSVNNFWDKDEMLQHIISHPDLTHHIVDTMRKNRFALKV